ncbi:MAG TPA: alpha/beta fold hydrolase [Puia sp.]|nr:alpha/beta fold hydrolase [Puia sp.]
MALSYRIEGEGTGSPVVLLHGFAEDGAIWNQQLAFLKKNHLLIIPDLPGSGQSSPLSGPITLEELAEFIKAILDAEKITQCILIGHSMGGYITLAFAEKYPDRLKALGLFHSIAFADSEEKKAGRQKSIEFIGKNGAPAYIRQSTPNLFSEYSRKAHPEWITSLTDRYAASIPADTLIYYQQAMISRPDRSQVLAQFPKPVLFIIGQQDNVIPLDASLRQTHIPVLSYIHLLENSGHMGMIEDSAASQNILHDFLRPY